MGKSVDYRSNWCFAANKGICLIASSIAPQKKHTKFNSKLHWIASSHWWRNWIGFPISNRILNAWMMMLMSPVKWEKLRSNWIFAHTQKNHHPTASLINSWTLAEIISNCDREIPKFVISIHWNWQCVWACDVNIGELPALYGLDFNQL